MNQGLLRGVVCHGFVYADESVEHGSRAETLLTDLFPTRVWAFDSPGTARENDSARLPHGFVSTTRCPT